MNHNPSSDSAGLPTSHGPVLPDAAALVPARIGAGANSRWGALAVSADGEVEELGAEEALARLQREAVMVVHPAFTARRIALGLPG
ncbi:MAG TPA: hypothetical protein PKA57_07415, partial [Parvibaculum sp.]|uniref:hypothetical protein n=1 Tax=Parvibaculum sp. TaxID=2024848 RepID=UPI002B7A6EB5